MEYQRSGAGYGTNVEYDIKFDIPTQSTNKVEAIVQLSPINADIDYNYDLNLPPGGRFEELEGRYEVELDFNQIEEGWIEIKNTAGDNPRASIKLDVPHPNVFEISRTIVKGHGFFWSGSMVEGSLFSRQRSLPSNIICR